MLRIRPSSPGKAARLLLLALCCATVWAGSGCRARPRADADWPSGTLVIAEKAALERVLSRLERLEGTPLARLAATLAGGLPPCAWLEGRAEGGPPSAVWSALQCRGAESAFPGLDRERGGREIAFAVPAASGERVVGTLAVDANADVEAVLLLPRAAFADTVALALPGDEAPGPALLSRRDELIHVRVRPEGGLDIASLVPERSQADQLFRLKSELFAGTVLDGTWEAAIYLPGEDDAMPPAALAVGFLLRDPAVAAMNRFIADLEAAWPVHRSPFELGSVAGACLRELKLLPSLAPCYVATDRALVIGWNAASLRRALAADAAKPASKPLDAGGGVVVDLDRIRAADAHFARRSGDASAAPERPYPWHRITADGVREGDRVRLQLHLDAGAGA